jgi:hypothetical protein
MNLTRPKRIFKGERVIAIAPTPKPHISERWNRRLNYHTGRTLTHTALNVEQHHHSGHLSMYGRQLSPGTVYGLELSYDATDTPSDSAPETEAAESTESSAVIVTELESIPGPTGEALPADAVWELQVSTGLGLTVDGEDVSLPRPLKVPVDGIPVQGSAGADPGGTARGLGIVLLQPIVADSAGPQDDKDPCEIDPSNDAFEDWQLVDGCRLAWFHWPVDQIPLPPAGNRFRNELAYAIFAREQQSAGQPLPWEAFGLPLAVAYINQNGAVTMVDRYAVVRQGGAPRTFNSTAVGAGTPFLWQARIQAFLAHVRDLEDQGQTIDEAIQHFRYLPPAGFLPKAVLDLESFSTEFFRSHYNLQAVPVPLEQLEVALEASAALRPYDLLVSDQVKILVPVPQAMYEPRLLKEESVDPIFGETIEDLMTELNTALGQRKELRKIGIVVTFAIDPALKPEYPDPDPEAVPGEEPISPSPANASGDDVEHTHEDQATDALQKLFNWLDANSPLSDSELEKIDPTKMDELTFIGVKPFIAELEKKINAANEKIDFGFLRLQTDIYRVRQIMLGAEEATRLATSPVLASIAKGETSFATQQNLKTYFEGVKTLPDSGTRFTASAAAFPGGGGSGSGIIGGSGSGGIFDSGPRGGLFPVFDDKSIKDVSTVEDVTKRSSIDKIGIFDSSALFDDSQQKAVVGVSSDEIFEKDPIIGEAREFRTTTIADRAVQPPAPEAKSFAVATKASVLSGFAELDMKLDDIEVTVAGADTAILTKEQFDTLIGLEAIGPNEETVLRGRARTAGDNVALYLGAFTDSEKKLLGDKEDDLRQVLNSLVGRNKGKLTATGLSGMVLGGWLDPDPADGDEAAFISRGVNALESTVAILRRVEGRVNRYKKALAECQKTLASLVKISNAWDTDLKEVDDNISEYRHDVTVARSLLAEEQARVDAINERRADILKNQVSFLAYMRPRTVSLRLDAPSVELHGVFTDPVPACLRQDAPAPDELQDMLDLFRDIPLKWLPYVRQLLIKLDRPEILKNAFLVAQQKAKLRTDQPVVLAQSQALSAPFSSAVKYGQTISKVLTAYRQTTFAYVQKRSLLDLQRLDKLSWKEASKQAQEDLSLDDLIEGGKGRSGLAQQATREMAHLEDVAVCLYARCGDMAPAVRLRWADQISIFDESLELRNLDLLPEWNKVDFELRRDLQRLVDWMFSRVDRKIPDAVALMNDLVRVCILLASHAPVSSIINGHVPEPATGKVGDVIDLALDRGKVRVGMQVAVFSGLNVAVQGIVEDLSATAARVKVTQSKQTTFQIEQGAKAQFFKAGAAASKYKLF